VYRTAKKGYLLQHASYAAGDFSLRVLKSRLPLYSLAVMIITLLCMSTAGCEKRAVKSDKPHHTVNGYRTPWLEEDHGFFDFMKWRWERLWKDIPSPESYHFPLANNDAPFLRSNTSKTTFTWIGHATLLLQIEGINILTDPQFSERSSPVQWAGPERVVQPGIALDSLPQIHAVVISHDHYDSLDTASVTKLSQRKGGSETIFIVPLGLKNWFARLGIDNVRELDWWDEIAFGPLKIIATPMQHWGKRSPFTRNDHLWASWVVLSEDFRFYFGGDTGYSHHFKETGDRFGPFDLAALPIGAYEPRWFMKNHHINPEEAVQAHIDIRARKSVAIHWGTFILTDEPLDEPPERLKKAMAEKGIPEGEFLVLKHGETIVLE
jgi:L-ascorbate metabolism protein UlaG (beta-lactamase superfamily)